MSQAYPQLHREVYRTFGRLRPRFHRLSFEAPGGKVDLRVKLVEGATRLVVNFHGALDREKRDLPVFVNGVPGIADAHQISVADPTMSLLDKPFRISWYAGHEGFDAQGVIGTILNAAARALKAQRTVYFGNSGGGFAALYFSWLHRGSIAVVGNPQTDIAAHFPTPVADYLRYCWPSLSGADELPRVIRSNLAALYREGFPNTVIYIQSLGDRMHYQNHMLPFAAAVAGTPDARRFLLHSDFGGTLGHVASPQDCTDWVGAACNAPTKDPTDILTTLHALRSARSANPLLAGLMRRKPALPVAPAPRRGATAKAAPDRAERPAAVAAGAAPAAAPQPPAPSTEAASAAMAAAAAPPPARTADPRGFAAEDLAIAERLRAWREANAGTETVA
ncbi:hypothetical protein [Novosphingobium huizhouense]|uniref:hypothetical protein n=1 Tax=Novosphingobium huizhouense TaxID=2866625 RepID=UPI001CD81C63|nr:hypothetical protein [Novosphingobium huizhouense]